MLALLISITLHQKELMPNVRFSADVMFLGADRFVPKAGFFNPSSLKVPHGIEALQKVASGLVAGTNRRLAETMLPG